MNGQLFFYSGYWRTWSRVLLENFGSQYVELDLTPINGYWARVAKERIRVHCTERGRYGDRFANVLPDEVFFEMEANLGPKVVERLLHFDYLPNIDWFKYRRIQNGGAEFSRCQKDFAAAPIRPELTRSSYPFMAGATGDLS